MTSIGLKKKDIFYLINKHSSVISKTETDMLLTHLFNCAKVDLYVRDFVIDGYIEKQYDSLVERRLNAEPVQYITGRAGFMGFDFIVTPDTFIPRPETELLVNEICRGGFQTLPYILDICTGSGNIAISLARLIPDAKVVAIDISEPALKIAEKNAMLHNVTDRIRFYQGNLFDALVLEKDIKFDIIVCNPPYIKDVELKDLQKEVRFEPELSLNGGRDGLDFYRMIAEKARGYLKRGGGLLLEIGFNQAQAVKAIFSLNNIYDICRIIKDFNGIDRVVCFKSEARNPKFETKYEITKIQEAITK